MVWRVVCTSCEWSDNHRVAPTVARVSRRDCPWCGAAVKVQRGRGHVPDGLVFRCDGGAPCVICDKPARDHAPVYDGELTVHAMCDGSYAKL